MDIQKRAEEDVLILSLTGDFDTTEAENYGLEIAGVIEDGYLKIVLDLSGLEFVNSTGLGALLRSQKVLGQYGGGLVVVSPTRSVEKTFRILQLHQRIPLFADIAGTKTHLDGISPEVLSDSGEEVEFHIPGAVETFGPRPRRGHREDLDDGALVLTFENLDGLDPDVTFAPGSAVKLKFRLPLYHPSHVFDVDSEIVSFDLLGRETIMLRLRFTAITDVEQAAVKQYVKDMRYIKEEG